jgi:hypothetical protein
MRRTNPENPDTSTAKQRLFDRTLALHTDCLGVSCRVQAIARFQPRALWNHGNAILLQMTMRKDRRNLTTFGYFKLLLEARSKRLLSTVALISPFETPQVL